MGYKLYLDDVRTPIDNDWIIVRSYDEFVDKVKEIGLNNIDTISFDHDLGDSAMNEYFENTVDNYIINYDNINEKTGYDCTKWLVEHYIGNRKQISHPTIDDLYIDDPNQKFEFPTVYVHSANPIGSHNICGYFENFFKNFRQKRTCVRVTIKFKIITNE